jgi:hypothetical protein
MSERGWRRREAMPVVEMYEGSRGEERREIVEGCL